MSKRRDGLYRQAGSPYWFADYVDGRGKRRRRSTKCRSRRDAARKRAEWVAAAGRGEGRLPEKATYIEIRQDLENDYAQKGNRSWDRVALALHHLDHAFGHLKVLDITSERIRGYATGRLDVGASPATRRYELATLRRMLRLAWHNGKLSTVPPFPTIRVNNAREEYITEQEFAGLLVELPDYLREFAAVLYLTGWRRSEVQQLRWSQVDWKAGVIVLLRGSTKSGEPRVFPFHNYADLKSVLERQRERTDQWERIIGNEIPWVFSRHGKQIRDFYHAWRSACRRVGALGADGRSKHPHDMRRSAARRMEQAGLPRSASMRLLGHKTDSMFRRYAVVANQDLDAATAQLNASGHSMGIVNNENAPQGASIDAS